MTERLPAPIERLVLSRERMRVALRTAAASRATAGGRPSGEAVGAWFGALQAIPGVGAVVDAACRWWDRHPLRPVALALVVVAKSALQPIAQRHPLGLLIGAAALGAVLFWSRPWQVIIRPALWAGLLPSVLAAATAGAPLQSWLATLAGTSRPVDPVAVP